jgi:hypothetical protein
MRNTGECVSLKKGTIRPSRVPVFVLVFIFVVVFLL